MHLRPYRDDDFETLAGAWRAASVVAHDFLTPDFLDAEVESIREVYLPAAETWIAESEGQPVGFLSLMGSEIGALFVHPGHWGKGIGQALLAKAIELRGDLLLKLFAENTVGRHFFAAAGFVEKGTETHAETGREVVRLELAATGGARPEPNDSGAAESKDL